MKYTCSKCGSLREITSLSVANQECNVCARMICGSCDSIRCESCRNRVHLSCSTFLNESRVCRDCHFKAARERMKDRPFQEQALATLKALETGEWVPPNRRKTG